MRLVTRTKNKSFITARNQVEQCFQSQERRRIQASITRINADKTIKLWHEFKLKLGCRKQKSKEAFGTTVNKNIQTCTITEETKSNKHQQIV